MTVLRFRPYAATDRDACLAIFDSNCPGFLHPDERIDFEGWLDSIRGVYLVLEEDRAVVGCGGYSIGAGNLGLNWGLLHAGHHGRGLGKALLLRRLAGGLERGGVRVVDIATGLTVEPFFARLGFERVKHTPNGWAPGMDRVDVRLRVTPAVAAEVCERWSELQKERGVEG